MSHQPSGYYPGAGVPGHAPHGNPPVHPGFPPQGIHVPGPQIIYVQHPPGHMPVHYVVAPAPAPYGYGYPGAVYHPQVMPPHIHQQPAVSAHSPPPPAETLETWFPNAADIMQIEEWFRALDPDHNETVGGAPVVKFLSLSNLDKTKLRTMWAIVDANRSGRLNRNQFISLIRFVSVLCSPLFMGSEPTIELFNKALKVDIPLPSQLCEKGAEQVPASHPAAPVDVHHRQQDVDHTHQPPMPTNIAAHHAVHTGSHMMPDMQSSAPHHASVDPTAAHLPYMTAPHAMQAHISASTTPPPHFYPAMIHPDGAIRQASPAVNGSHPSAVASSYHQIAAAPPSHVPYATPQHATMPTSSSNIPSISEDDVEFSDFASAKTLETWFPNAADIMQIEEWFRALDPDHNETVGGAPVVKFLSLSNLDKAKLRTMWAIVDANRSGRLNRNQFISLIRFVSVLCSPLFMGSEPTIELFNKALKVDIPLPSQLCEKKKSPVLSAANPIVEAASHHPVATQQQSQVSHMTSLHAVAVTTSVDISSISDEDDEFSDFSSAHPSPVPPVQASFAESIISKHSAPLHAQLPQVHVGESVVGKAQEDEEDAFGEMVAPAAAAMPVSIGRHVEPLVSAAAPAHATTAIPAPSTDPAHIVVPGPAEGSVFSAQENRLSVFDELVEQDLQGLAEEWDDFADVTVTSQSPVPPQSEPLAVTAETAPAVEEMHVPSSDPENIPPEQKEIVEVESSSTVDVTAVNPFDDFDLAPLENAPLPSLLDTHPPPAPIAAPLSIAEALSLAQPSISSSMMAADEDDEFGDFAAHADETVKQESQCVEVSNSVHMHSKEGFDDFSGPTAIQAALADSMFAEDEDEDFGDFASHPHITAAAEVDDLLFLDGPVETASSQKSSLPSRNDSAGDSLLDLLSEPLPIVSAAPPSTASFAAFEPFDPFVAAPPQASTDMAFEADFGELEAAASPAAQIAAPVATRTSSSAPSAPTQPTHSKPLSLAEIESLALTLAKRRLYEEAYACAHQLTVLRKLDVLTKQKTQAMEDDDLETALQLKKAATAMVKDLSPQSVEAEWVAASLSGRNGQSVEEMEESIALFDEVLAKKFHKVYVTNAPTIQSGLEASMRHAILAKRTSRMILATCSSHTQHPAYWKRLMSALKSRIDQVLKVQRSFTGLSTADQQALMETAELSTFFTGAQRLAEGALWLAATIQEAMLYDSESKDLWKAAQDVLKNLSATWTQSNSELLNLSREDMTIATEVLTERRGLSIRFCNFTLRPLRGSQSGGAESCYYPHQTQHQSLDFMQPLVSVWLQDIDKKLPNISSAFC